MCVCNAVHVPPDEERSLAIDRPTPAAAWSPFPPSFLPSFLTPFVLLSTIRLLPSSLLNLLYHPPNSLLYTATIPLHYTRSPSFFLNRYHIYKPNVTLQRVNWKIFSTLLLQPKIQLLLSLDTTWPDTPMTIRIIITWCSHNFYFILLYLFIFFLFHFTIFFFFVFSFI